MRHRLLDRGCQAAIATAGFLEGGQPVPPEVLKTMDGVGIDLRGHLSRKLDARLLDAADLVVTMTGQHVVDTTGVSPDAWPRTFTIRELLARAEPVGTWDSADDLASWVRRVGAGRTRAGVLGLPLADDIVDPMIRHRQRDFDRTRDELDGLVGRLADLLCPKRNAVS